jgi:proteasome beta subunit
VTLAAGHPFVQGSRGVLPLPFDPAASSFAALLADVVPDAVRSGRVVASDPTMLAGLLAEGTTILAVRGLGGVVVAGDRRATSGHLIARADLRKVFPADSHSAVAISGAAGPAMELARILATELEHYEKVEGEPLTLEGKSSRLAGLLRANLPLTLQGLIVVPLFAGFDVRAGTGRIFEYDPIGGRYVAAEQAVAGSGSLAARSTLRRLADAQAPLTTAAATAVEALVVAAEDDSATGGPDPGRGIYPIVAVIDEDGYRELPEPEVAALVAAAMEGRRR